MGPAGAAVESFMNGLGFDVVSPPPLNRDTLTLGSQHSPEFACLPLKANLGSFLQMDPEKIDLIFMAGGVGPCRFGLYGEVQREILRYLGSDKPFIVIEPPEKHLSELVGVLNRYLGRGFWARLPGATALAWTKMSAMDEVERSALKIMARLQNNVFEAFRRDKNRQMEQIAQCESIFGIRKLHRQTMDWIGEYNRSIENLDVLRVKIVGELLVVLEPAINFNIAERLARLGVEVEQTIEISSWVRKNIFLNMLGVKWQQADGELVKPYLSRFIGGHGLESVSYTMKAARDAYDGVVQLAPLGCMPELIATEIIDTVAKKQDFPALTLFLDEHTAGVGLQTRLEAFVDLMRSRRSRKPQIPSV